MPRSPTKTTRSMPKRSADRLHGRGKRLCVRGVAREDLDRHRPALRRADETVVDLELARFAVAGVAEGRQRAAAALQIARGEVVEHEPPGARWRRARARSIRSWRARSQSMAAMSSASLTSPSESSSARVVIWKRRVAESF